MLETCLNMFETFHKQVSWFNVFVYAAMRLRCPVFEHVFMCICIATCVRVRVRMCVCVCVRLCVHRATLTARANASHLDLTCI